jgi:hypothetical protein
MFMLGWEPEPIKEFHPEQHIQYVHMMRLVHTTNSILYLFNLQVFNAIIVNVTTIQAFFWL